jgi:hypothetical protein
MVIKWSIKMFCIKSIEVVEVNREVFEHHLYDERESILIGEGSKAKLTEMSFVRELITGRKFIRDGQTYCIGMAKDVQEILKLPIDCIDNLERQIKHLEEKLDRERDITSDVKKELDKVNKAHYNLGKIVTHMGIDTSINVYNTKFTFYQAVVGMVNKFDVLISKIVHIYEEIKGI